MLLLVSGTTKYVEEQKADPNLGVLLAPDVGQSMDSVRRFGLPFAADNSAFKGFNPEKYLRMLRKMRGASPLWVTVPDVVGDAATTLSLWKEWAGVVRDHGYHPALVAQDGLREEDVPWEEVWCLFIGGSTEFKEGEGARKLTAVAKGLGKWVHMGRVNTKRRIHLARRWGVDSIDGSGFSMFSRTLIPKGLRWIREPLQGEFFDRPQEGPRPF